MRKKKKDGIIVGTEVLLLCMIVGILRINAMSSNPPSSGVNYNKNSQTNVQDAINDLYSKVAYGDAASDDILSGKKALVGGKKVVGTFTCPTFEAQTVGNAGPEDLEDGKIAWVNGKKVVGRIALNLGDYVRYVSSGEYTVTKEELGSGANKVFALSNYRVWRVIKKNVDGTVEIVLDYTYVRDLPYIGFGFNSDTYVGYYNFIGILNKIAKAFETEGYTVGSRHMGYDSTKSREYVTSKSESDDGYLTDVELVEQALGTLAGGGERGDDYWLASRGDHELRYVEVHETGFTTVSSCYRNDVAGGCGEKFIRPIVTLSTEVKITGGNGTKDSPYTLGL